MSQPTPGDLHVNRPLTNISIAHFQSEENFVSNRAGHIIPVERQTDTILRFKKGAMYRDEMAIRAPGAESVGGGYEMDSALTYYCPLRAFHHDIPDQVRANTDSPLSNDRAATHLVTRKALIRSERLFATNFLASGAGWDVKRAGVASGSYTLDTNVINWDDYTNSNPINDVRFYATKVALANGGFRPKHGVISRSMWDVLAIHPDFVSLISGGATSGNPSIVTRQLVAAAFELESLLVMDSVYDSAAENATWAPAWIAGDAFLLYYKPPTPAIEMPSAFYGFGWTGMLGMSAMGGRVKKFRMEANASDRIEIEQAIDWKLTGADMAALLYDLKA
jgi:hypothetical protein